MTFSLSLRCNFFSSHHSKHTQETNTHAGGVDVYIYHFLLMVLLCTQCIFLSRTRLLRLYTPQNKKRQNHIPPQSDISHESSPFTHTHTQAAFRSHHEYHSALDHHFHAEQSHTHSLSLTRLDLVLGIVVFYLWVLFSLPHDSSLSLSLSFFLFLTTCYPLFTVRTTTTTTLCMYVSCVILSLSL